MKKAPKKYHTFGTVPKSRRKIVKRGNIDILTHKYMTGRSLFWLDTGTSVKRQGQTSLFSEMIRSYKYFPHLSKMPILT